MGSSGLYLYLPYHEKNEEFVADMEKSVPWEGRSRCDDIKAWLICFDYLESVDRLLLRYFGPEGFEKSTRHIKAKEHGSE